jgi:hypothetical protein
VEGGVLRILRHWVLGWDSPKQVDMFKKALETLRDLPVTPEAIKQVGR